MNTVFLEYHPFTVWKVSKYGVISGPNTGKYGPEIAPYLDTFHAVIVLKKHLKKLLDFGIKF